MRGVLKVITNAKIVVVVVVVVEVLPDWDPRFTADFWTSLWKVLGSRAVFSSAYHPQTDGRTERMHRTIE